MFRIQCLPLPITESEFLLWRLAQVFECSCTFSDSSFSISSETSSSEDACSEQKVALGARTWYSGATGQEQQVGIAFLSQYGNQGNAAQQSGWGAREKLSLWT